MRAVRPLFEKTGAQRLLLYFLLFCAVLAAYHNSFQGPFVFDGRLFIENGNAIRQIWPIDKVLYGSSRPLTRLSFALNYFFTGLDVFWFHIVNFLIHVFSGFLLFWLIRLTLSSPKLKLPKDYPAGGIAFASALLWLVHPLQTESVTYIYQRAALLMGMFYLLTLYSLARSFSSQRRVSAWLIASVIFCAFGMGCKAVMVTAPVMALAYDRVFWSGSWKDLWQRRRWFYPALAASWLILVIIVLEPHESRSTAGFGISYTTTFKYASVQPGVILHYLKLAFLPRQLALDYGWNFVYGISGSALPYFIIFAILVSTVWMLLKRPALGFLGFWFFLALIPTSSFFPLADPLFEHRMYLPLASVVLSVVLAAHALARRFIAEKMARISVLCLLLAASAGALSARTIIRNNDYRSGYVLWKKTTAARPNNPRPHRALAKILARRGESGNAVSHYKKALRSRRFGEMDVEGDQRDKAAILDYNVALVLSDRNKLDAAISYYRKALELKPDFTEARNNLAILLAKENRFQDALNQLFKALTMDDDSDNSNNERVKLTMRDVLECIALQSQPDKKTQAKALP